MDLRLGMVTRGAINSVAMDKLNMSEHVAFITIEVGISTPYHN